MKIYSRDLGELSQFVLIPFTKRAAKSETSTMATWTFASIASNPDGEHFVSTNPTSPLHNSTTADQTQGESLQLAVSELLLSCFSGQ